MFTLAVTRVPDWYLLASKDLLVRECRHITIDIFPIYNMYFLAVL